MTEPETNPPELSHAEEDAVRRHLASARHTEPMPDAVAERLDRVLVGLSNERTPTSVVRPVTDLTARRRRRRGAQLLLAAAAVVVAGVGISQLPGPASDDAGGGSTLSGDAPDAAAEGHNDAGADNEERAPALPSAQPTTYADALSRLPVIRPDHFRADVARPQALAGVTMSSAYERAARKALDAACPAAAKGERILVVTYAGALAELVYRAPTDDGQRVDLYRCDGRDDASGLVRSVVLPSP